MELENLVGKHMLSGVDYSDDALPEGYTEDMYGDASCINFVLDGTTYTAVEDAEDGYRSSMRELLSTGYAVSNTFGPIEVMCSMSEREYSTILEMRDTVNGKLILEVGTDYSDSYYPSFVGHFIPQDMHINEGKADA